MDKTIISEIQREEWEKSCSFAEFKEEVGKILTESKKSALAQITRLFKIATRRLLFGGDDQFLYMLITAKLPYVTKKDCQTYIAKTGLKFYPSNGIIEVLDFNYTKNRIKGLVEQGFKPYVDNFKIDPKNTDVDTKTLAKKEAKSFVTKVKNLSKSEYMPSDVAYILRKVIIDISDKFEL